MSNYLISRDEILVAINRANIRITPDKGVHFAPQDGTYSIIPTWVGNDRVWMAQRITEYTGYEIAHRPVMDGRYWYPLDVARFGYWQDRATGETHLDETIHVRGNYVIALEIGAKYNQLAIWDWADNSEITIEGN